MISPSTPLIVQLFYGVYDGQGYVGGTGTAAGEAIALKRQGLGIVMLDANQPVTAGQELIASAGTYGTVKARGNFSGSCVVLGTAEESLSASSSAQRLEAYIQPYRLEDTEPVSVSQPTKTTVVGAATVYGAGVGDAFAAAPVALYVARYAGQTVQNLGVQAAVAPGGADTLIATVMTSTDNGNTYVARSVTCTMTGAAFSASDLANSYTLAAGEIVALRFVSSGGAAAGVSATLTIT